MADLITNLNSIYNTKLQLKEALGTESDIFSEYPSYVNALKPSGYAYVISNGDFDVSSYKDVNVNVPVPAGYTYVSGEYRLKEADLAVTQDKYLMLNNIINISSYAELNNNAIELKNLTGWNDTYTITANGTYNVTCYSNAYVNIPAPAGTYNITANGTYVVSGYANAYVDVQSGGGSPSFTVPTMIVTYLNPNSTGMTDEYITYTCAGNGEASEVVWNFEIPLDILGGSLLIENTYNFCISENGKFYPFCPYTYNSTGSMNTLVYVDMVNNLLDVSYPDNNNNVWNPDGWNYPCTISQEISSSVEITPEASEYLVEHCTKAIFHVYVDSGDDGYEPRGWSLDFE